MRFVLHVGTEKTGTTTLQRWLHRNGDLLKKQGVWYNYCFGRPGNRNISVFAANSAQFHSVKWRGGPQRKEDLYKWKAVVEKEFEKEVNEAYSAGAHTFVVSSEHCHSRLVDQDMIVQLHNLVAGKFSTLEVYCVLRPQVDVLVSGLSTLAREGEIISKEIVNIDSDSAYFNYFELYRRWSQVFDGNVFLIPYRRNQDTVDVFCNVMGLRREELVAVGNKNESLDYRVLAMLNSIARLEHAHKIEKKCISRIVDSISFEKGVILSRVDAGQIQHKFEESNRALTMLSADLTLSDLSVDLESFPMTGNFDLVAEPAVFSELLRIQPEIA